MKLTKAARRDILTTLDEAYKLVKNKDNWLQGWEAQTADGIPTNATDENATKFCMYGAVRAAVYRNFPKRPDYMPVGLGLRTLTRPQLVLRAMYTLEETLDNRPNSKPSNLMEWNDELDTTHRKVLNLFRHTQKRLNEFSTL